MLYEVITSGNIVHVEIMVSCIKPFFPYDFDLELPTLLPAGQVKWMRLHSRPRRLPDGRTIWNGVQIDITKHKQAEEALKKAHETLEEKVKERTAELEEAYNSLKESERGLAEAQKMAP